jgi:hypothetical protein
MSVGVFLEEIGISISLPHKEDLGAVWRAPFNHLRVQIKQKAEEW